MVQEITVNNKENVDPNSASSSQATVILDSQPTIPTTNASSILSFQSNDSSNFNYHYINKQEVYDRKRDEERRLEEIDRRRLILATKDFYEENEKNWKFSLTEYNYIGWKKTPGVGKHYRMFVNRAPLVVVCTLFVLENKMEKKCFMENKDLENSDYINRLLLKDDTVGNRGYKHWKKECHFKRAGYIIYYLKYLFGYTGQFLRENLKDYSDIENFYNKYILNGKIIN